MRRYDGFFNVLFKNRGPAPVLAAALAPALLFAGGTLAASLPEPAVKLLATIPVPVRSAVNKTGGLYAFDISFVDQQTQTYYLADRSNAAVDVANATNGAFIRAVTASPPFVGVATSCASGNNNDCSGPNGVATGVVNGRTCLFAGDGGSRVVSFQVPSYTQADSKSTGGAFRADEMAFAPISQVQGLLLVVNDAELPPPAGTGPFATLISVDANCKMTISAKIPLSFATAGVEQPIWNPANKHFYVAIPSISGTAAAPGPLGEIARINPTTAKIDQGIAVYYCSPAGLTLGPHQTALANCSTVYDEKAQPWSGTDTATAAPADVIVDLRTTLITYVQGAGAGDEAWYNSGDNHYYATAQSSPWAPSVVVSGGTSVSQGAGMLAVVDASSLTLDQLVPTFNVPKVVTSTGTTVHPAGSAHSVAANAANNWVFVPAPANNVLPRCLKGCIGIYGRNDIDSD